VIAFLPETKKCGLPDTLEDGEHFGRYVAAYAQSNSGLKRSTAREKFILARSDKYRPVNDMWTSLCFNLL
jgi:hypothetical protein